MSPSHPSLKQAPVVINVVFTDCRTPAKSIIVVINPIVFCI